LFKGGGSSDGNGGRKIGGHLPIFGELGSSIKKLPLLSAELITTGEATSQHQRYLAQISAAKLSASQRKNEEVIPFVTEVFSQLFQTVLTSFLSQFSK
jgi:hypothetical protein